MLPSSHHALQHCRSHLPGFELGINGITGYMLLCVCFLCLTVVHDTRSHCVGSCRWLTLSAEYSSVCEHTTIHGPFLLLRSTWLVSSLGLFGITRLGPFLHMTVRGHRGPLPLCVCLGMKQEHNFYESPPVYFWSPPARKSFQNWGERGRDQDILEEKNEVTKKAILFFEILKKWTGGQRCLLLDP